MATLNGVNYSNTSGLLLKTNATTQMSISTGGVIEFNQSYTFPTSDGLANTVLLTNGSGALSFSKIPNASLDNSSLTVTAGSGLANGGSVSLGSSVTLNVGAGTGIVVNANDVALDYVGTNNFIDSATNLEGTSIALTDTIVYHDATDNIVKKGLVSDLPYTTNVGDITSVTAGNGLTGGGTSGAVTLNVGAGTGLVVNANDIALDTNSSLNVNHSSITMTAGNGLTGGGTIASSRTFNVGAGTGISVAADTVGLDTSNTRNVDHSSVSISAGTGLTGGGTIASNRTISLDYAGVDNFIDSAANLEGTSISSSDTIIYHDATDSNVKKGFVSDLPFSNNSGTVTSVAISGTDGIDVDSGSPITSSGTITLGLSNIPNSSLANSSIDIAGSDISLGGQVTGDDIIADVSAGQITNTQLVNSSITINGTATSLGGSINVGDINGVTAGNGLTGGGTSGTVTLNVGAGTLIDVAADTISVDLSELSTSTSNGDGDFFVVVNTANAQKKLTKGNINISGFNNDAGFTTNTGTVTSVAISGNDGIDVDSGSPITGSGTIALGLSNVPNSVLSNSSFTVNGVTGSDPVVPLGGALNFTSSDGTVAIDGNSTTDTIDFRVTDSVNTYVTGGTFTSGTLSLGLNDGTSAQDIPGFWSSIPNSALSNSSITINGSAIALGGSINVGDITAVTAGNGLTGGGSSGSVTLNVGAGTGISVAANTVGLDTSNTRNVDHASVSISAGTGLSGGGTIASSRTISLDYAGTNNFIDSATNLEGTSISTLDTIVYHDATDNIVKKGLVSDLPFTNTLGTVTSVSISGSDGIDVDSGSPITTSGTIALGLSNVPNSSLANSSITIAGSSISLGGSISADLIIGQVSAGEILLTQLEEDSITINGTAVSLGGSINVGDITGVSAGNGLTGGGSSGSVTLNVGAGTGITVAANTVGLDYAGTNNFIDSATNLEGSSISTSDTIIYHDASDNNVKKGLVSDLPFTNSSGSVTSVAISGSDGIDVDSGSPITSSGTIALGLSNVPNSSLANSSITINGTAVSLGGTINVGDITSVGAGAGLTGGGTSGAVTLNVDYAGTDNYILAAGAGTGDILTSWHIPVSNASNNVLYYDVLALPFSNNQGTVTSVAISGTDGIDVDSGSPITTNGTITLGLSNVPNTSLANSSVTVTGGNGLTGGGAVSLGGSVTLNVGAGALIDVDGSNVNVDLSELTTSTSDGDGDYFVVVNTSNAQRKLTKANISLSGFNDDVSLYKSDGSLTSSRLVTQSNNTLDFRAINNERTSFTRTTNTPNSPTRVFMEANDSYANVLELYSTAPPTNIVQGFDAGQAPVFTVDGQGNLTATSKAFDIPHPNPEKKEQGMRLKHGNLEGPEHGIYIRGRQLNDKEIELPEYWKDLVDPDSITVQLTSVGTHQNLYVKEIKDWVVYIQNGNLFSNKIDCYYFIQAERMDVDKIEVEYIPQ
jgi:hypothetical protein